MAPQTEKNFSSLSTISRKKKRVGIFIQARTGSKRLPTKVLKMVNRKTILERCILSLLPLLEHPNIDKEDMYILCPLSDQRNFQKIADKYKIKFNTCFNSNENKVLERFYDAANLTNVDYVLRACSDKIINHTSTQLAMVDFVLENKLEYLGCDKDPLRSTTGEIYNAESLKSLYREIAPSFIHYLDEDGFEIEHSGYNYNYNEISEHISPGFNNLFDIEPQIECNYDWSINTKEQLKNMQEMVASYYIKHKPKDHFLELEKMIKIKKIVGLLR